MAIAFMVAFLLADLGITQCIFKLIIMGVLVRISSSFQQEFNDF